jgi:hypothetical protein
MVKELTMQSELKRDTRIFKLLILIAIVASLLSVVLVHAGEKPMKGSAASADSLYEYVKKDVWLKQIEDNRAWSEQQFEVSLTAQQRTLRQGMLTWSVMYQTVKAVEQDSIRVKK